MAEGMGSTEPGWGGQEDSREARSLQSSGSQTSGSRDPFPLLKFSEDSKEILFM